MFFVDDTILFSGGEDGELQATSKLFLVWGGVW